MYKANKTNVTIAKIEQTKANKQTNEKRNKQTTGTAKASKIKQQNKPTKQTNKQTSKKNIPKANKNKHKQENKHGKINESKQY